MILGLILTLMTFATLGALAWPFVFGGRSGSAGGDVAVYKDQLAEIERDREAGLIEADAAEGARIEVSRRLLRASAARTCPRSPAAQTGRRLTNRQLTALATVLVALPILTGAMYARLGSFGSASRGPITEQATATSDDDGAIAALVGEVERHLAEDPSDGHGWEVLAPVYARLGRYDDAARAWQNVIAKLGDNLDREESLGESLVAAANGTVTDEARQVFDHALSLDNTSVTARFYLGLAAKQSGQRDQAAKIWSELLAAAPTGAPWVSSVRQALARVDEPSVAESDVASAPTDQQNAMIRSMVERLSERLKANGDDPDGWVRLVRSYTVLGDSQMAGAAASDARHALASSPEKLATFEDGLKAIGATTPTASSATPPQHDATMQAMVDKLAERLSKEGGDADNWFMLVRSYVTLGESRRAAEAAAQARHAFASDPEKLALFDRLVNSAEAGQAQGQPAAQQNPAPAAAAPDQQTAMIKGMVANLAERLKQDGHDVDGWIRLMRSYVVLGQGDKAVEAGKNARLALSNDPESLRRINDAAKTLEIDLP